VLKNSTSYPYLSGDAFAELCDYAAYGKDGTRSLNLRKLRRARKLFVPGHRLNELLENHFEDISAAVLICGNSDQNFITDPVLPKSIKLWLCQNYAVENGFGSVLPIGLENLRLGKSGFKKYQKRFHGKQIDDKILLPPMQITNPIRAAVKEKCKKLPEVYEVYDNYLNTPSYFELLKQYSFVLVLEGNGFDTHRLWEVLYKGNTPILLDSPWSRNLYKIGVPICIIEDISVLNLEQARKHGNPRELSTNYHPLANMNYWRKLVSSYY
jgi:hypothetical protein